MRGSRSMPVAALHARQGLPDTPYRKGQQAAIGWMAAIGGGPTGWVGDAKR
jgi:hypothetical protein